MSPDAEDKEDVDKLKKLAEEMGLEYLDAKDALENEIERIAEFESMNRSVFDKHEGRFDVWEN